MPSTETFDTVYAAHQARVLRWAERMAGPELGADVAQLVWIRVFDRFDEFRGDSAVSTWLHVLVRNITSDLYRAQNRRTFGHARPIERAAHVPCPRENPEEAAARRERRRLIDAALPALSPEHQAVVIAALEDRSQEETAALLGISPNTVKSRTWRARDAMTRAVRTRLHPRAPLHCSAPPRGPETAPEPAPAAL